MKLLKPFLNLFRRRSTELRHTTYLENGRTVRETWVVDRKGWPVERLEKRYL